MKTIHFILRVKSIIVTAVTVVVSVFAAAAYSNVVYDVSLDAALTVLTPTGPGFNIFVLPGEAFSSDDVTPIGSPGSSASGSADIFSLPNGDGLGGTVSAEGTAVAPSTDPVAAFSSADADGAIELMNDGAQDITVDLELDWLWSSSGTVEGFPPFNEFTDTSVFLNIFVDPVTDIDIVDEFFLAPPNYLEGDSGTYAFDVLIPAGGMLTVDMFMVVNGEGITQAEVIPVPAAVWLFGSGLVVLTGVARRTNKSATRADIAPPLLCGSANQG